MTNHRRGLAALVLGACVLPGVGHAADSVFDQDPSGPKVTFEFAKLRSAVQPGDKIGKIANGSWCLGGKDMFASQRIEEIANGQAAYAFKAVAKAVSLPLFQKEVSPFETATSANADYRVGGTLQRLTFDVCFNDNQEKGENHVEVKWEVWSTKLQRVVMTRTTSGTGRSDSFVRNFEDQAYAQALRELLSSPDAKLLIAGTPPATKEAFEPLHITAHPVAVADAQNDAVELKKAVVTILSDVGSGSGFFVADGWLLTDRHVVGSTKYVKVRLHDGKEIVGEVMRQDPARDVALLKTTAVSLPALPVRTTDPATGENLFAIGSPLGQTFEGTFTRGVMSGTREIGGHRYFQSDVAANHGNSGGPLLDATGHVVGLTDWGIPQTAGLTFFVPIREALERLNVQVDDANAPAAAGPSAAAGSATVTTTTTTVSTPVTAAGMATAKKR